MTLRPTQLASLALLAALGTVACERADAEQRYQALLADGTRVEGRVLANANQPDRPPTLDGKPLGGEKNPPLVVRDAQSTIRRKGSWLELTNGDVLPCEVLGFGGGKPTDSAPAYWLVSPWRAALPEHIDRVDLRVRADMVRRAVLHGEGRTTYTPGMLVFRDGRRLQTRGLRFNEGRVTALSDGGVTDLVLAELAEIHVPRTAAEETAGVLDDAAFARALGETRLVRVRTTTGAEFTFPHSMMVEDQDRRRGRATLKVVAVRPLWSLDTTFLQVEEIVSRSYRAADEVPLSLLRVDSVVETAGVQHLPWRRNTSATGGPLAGGGVFAELGLGTHSRCELTFDLPPHARSFSSWVALDRAVGDGGCVRVKVFRDRAEGKPLWQSDFLRGGEPAVRVGPIDVAGAKRLVLVTEMAHEGRPEGADPLDVRDQLDWLRPTIEVDVDKLFQSRWRLSNWLPELAGWEISDDDRKRLTFQPFWNADEQCWSIAMKLDDARELVLQRRATIDATNAFLNVAAAVDGQGRGIYTVSVRADGEKVGPTMNGPILTDRRRGDYNTRVWLLGPHAGREVDLGLVITPSDGKNDRPHGLMFKFASPQPVVTNLPADARPIAPDVPLDALQPVGMKLSAKDDRYQPGKLSDGRPLTVRGFPFTQGFGLPQGSEITFPLADDYRRFVAVIGLCERSIDAGPFEILLDGKPHWTSDPDRYGRNTPAAQIDVPIPPGHRTITLKVSGRDCYGAWAQAGFMKQ